MFIKPWMVTINRTTRRPPQTERPLPDGKLNCPTPSGGAWTGPLIDSFGRTHTYLRISATDRCNLRCVYCMPPAGIKHTTRERILRFDEIVRLAGIFAGMGITKIRLTGGEPLVRKNIDELIADLSGVKGIKTIGLTTNGVRLSERARALKAAGVTHLNISLDTLRPDRYAEITLRDEYPRVLGGIDAALAAGFVPLKLNVVVIGGVNNDEILDFVEVTRTLPIIVRFIEYMPFVADRRRRARFVSSTAIRAAIEKRYSLAPVFTGEDSTAVAREYRIPGFTGTIGLISPMSDHFCARCNRLRLTADGSIKSCLFYPAELNLRDLLRDGISNAALAGMIRRVVREKLKAHPPAETRINLTDQMMIKIGG